MMTKTASVLRGGGDGGNTNLIPPRSKPGHDLLYSGAELTRPYPVVCPRIYSTDLNELICKRDLTPKSKTHVTKGKKGRGILSSKEGMNSPGIHFIF